MKRLLLSVLALCAAVLLSATYAPNAQATCVWEGKAPACNGKCRTGFKLIKTSKSGDGKKCVTGSKAYCCPAANVITRGAAPACNGKCKAGEIRVGDSKKGPNGKKCITGKAAVCYNPRG
ncbi:MAG: hypothetical protein R3E48_09045 [Burkholderiaceae bacterium]